MKSKRRIDLFTLCLVSCLVSFFLANPANAAAQDCNIVCSCSVDCSTPCEWWTCGSGLYDCKQQSWCSNGGCSTYLYGSSAGDTLHGTSGNDCIYGNAGDDTIFGEAGNDKLYGGTGSDCCFGGAGWDECYSCECGDCESGMIYPMCSG